MLFRVMERVTAALALSGFAGVLAIVSDPVSALIEADVHPAIYALAWTVIASLIVIRWMAKYGKHVTRTPEGRIDRVEDRVRDLEKENEKLKKELIECKKDLKLIVVNGDDK
jgi:hypothetical protein